MLSKLLLRCLSARSDFNKLAKVFKLFLLFFAAHSDAAEVDSAAGGLVADKTGKYLTKE